MNDKGPLNLFLDSGLADSEGASILLPAQTLEYLGTEVPEVRTVPDGIGGLGGNFPIGRFRINQCSLGALKHTDLQGIYGAFPPKLYTSAEFIIDGIVSHHLLKNYAWTINFDTMTMIFTFKNHSSK